MKSYVKCRLLNNTYDAGSTKEYHFQNSLLEEHKGNVKSLQRMKRKNLGVMLDWSWTFHQDHCLINQNAVQLILASTYTTNEDKQSCGWSCSISRSFDSVGETRIGSSSAKKQTELIIITYVVYIEQSTDALTFLTYSAHLSLLTTGQIKSRRMFTLKCLV